MIDGDGDGDYDELGTVDTTMGKIIGAKAQVWTGNLLHKDRDGGKIIVRSEVVQQSNECIRFDATVRNAGNVEAGCMGLCEEPFRYRMVIRKRVPGSDAFTTEADITMFTFEPQQ